MKKRWLQSFFIFVIIIIFAITGYLLLKKYDSNSNDTAYDDWMISTFEKRAEITLSVKDVKL